MNNSASLGRLAVGIRTEGGFHFTGSDGAVVARRPASLSRLSDYVHAGAGLQ